MKKVLSLVVVVALVAAGTAHAGNPVPESPVGISVLKSGDVVKLFYRGEQTGKVKVTIYNEKGEKVFIETLRQREHFMRPYNFSSLPEGEYTISLEDEQGTRTGNVTHRLSSAAKFAHLMRMRGPGSKYMLAVPGTESSSVTVKIYDQSDRLLYSKTEIVDGSFARLYNLSKVKGNHTFEVIDDNGRVNRLSKPLRR